MILYVPSGSSQCLFTNLQPGEYNSMLCLDGKNFQEWYRIALEMQTLFAIRDSVVGL